MEHGPFIDDLPITTVIFHSYVSLPAGIWKDHEKSLAHPTTHLLDLDWLERLQEQHSTRKTMVSGEDFPTNLLTN